MNVLEVKFFKTHVVQTPSLAPIPDMVMKTQDVLLFYLWIGARTDATSAYSTYLDETTHWKLKDSSVLYQKLRLVMT